MQTDWSGQYGFINVAFDSGDARSSSMIKYSSANTTPPFGVEVG